MQNLLFYTKHDVINPHGGREKLSAILYNSLKNNFKSNFYYFNINKEKSSFFDKFAWNYIDNVNYSNLKKLKSLLIKHNINNIFIDGSNFGSVCKYLKNNNLNIKIFVYFHNFESKFFLESFYFNRTLKSFFVFCLNNISEKKSLNNSDHIICLTKIDKKKIINMGFNKKIDILPLSVKDEFSENETKFINKKNKKYVMFIGTNFYANIHGIEWFLKNVSPFIEFDTYIIGKGFNKLEKKYKNKNIKFFGYQSKIYQFYNNASAIISPIFKGSGMETKIAEALMFGKVIVATSNSYRGYENLNNSTCIRANNKSEFITVLNKLYNNLDKKFENLNRLTYKKNYSEVILNYKLQQILVNEIYNHNT